MNGPDFSRYRSLVSSLASPALENPARCGLDAAVPAARLLLEDDPDLHAAFAEGFERIAAGDTMLSDTGGDRRDVYYPFALHLHLAAFNKLYEQLPTGLWSRCDEAMQQAVAPVREAENYISEPPGCDDVARVLWDVLCLYEYNAARALEVDVEWLDAVVHQVVDHPGDAGALHAVDESESIELWTYRELAALHALSNLALLRRNDGWAKRVAAVAAHHEANTQPDFTTTQPWGVFAFVWTNKPMFADQQLHDAQHAGGGTLHLIAALLLADAARALSAW